MSEQYIDFNPRFKRLEDLARIAFDTVRTLDDWLGHASTRNAPVDALWRLRRALEAEGFEDPVHRDLEWRGSLPQAMERSGIGPGEDDELRLRTSRDQPFPASWCSTTPICLTST